MNKRDQIESLRRQLGLKKYEIADQMGITPEWYGRVIKETGEAVPDTFWLRFEEFRRRQKTEQTSSSSALQADQVGGGVAEDQTLYGAPHVLLARARKHFDGLLAAADNDPARLGWINEQLRAHLSEPAHWGVHQRVMQRVLAREAARERPEEGKPVTERKAQ